MSQYYYFYCIFKWINAAFNQHYKKSYQPQTFECFFYTIFTFFFYTIFTFMFAYVILK